MCSYKTKPALMRYRFYNPESIYLYIRTLILNTNIELVWLLWLRSDRGSVIVSIIVYIQWWRYLLWSSIGRLMRHGSKLCLNEERLCVNFEEGFNGYVHYVFHIMDDLRATIIKSYFLTHFTNDYKLVNIL